MRRTTSVMLTSLFLFLTFAQWSLLTNSADAQLFGRVWDRRKAELRSELKRDVTQKIDVAAEALNSNLDEKFDGEVAELDAKFKQQVEAMHVQAEQLLAKESKRLQNQVKREFAKMRTDAAKRLLAEKKTLSDEMEKHVQGLNAEFEAQKKKNRQAIETFNEMNTVASARVIDQKVDEMKKELQTMIEDRLAQNGPEAPADDSRDAKKITSAQRGLKPTVIELVEVETESDTP